MRKKKRSRFGRGLLLGLWLTGIFVALFVGGMAWTGMRVTYNGVNMPNMVLDGIPVGGLTESETEQTLRKAGWDSLKDVPLTVSFPLSLSMQLDRLQAGACITAEEAAAGIYSLGHGENWFDNLQQYVRAKLSREFEVRLEDKALNENYIRANIHSVAERFHNQTGDPDLHLDKENARLTMIKGGGAISLDEEGIYRAVCAALQSGEKSLQWNEISGSVLLPDFKTVYSQLASEPQDAAFNERFEIIPEVVGCTFDVYEAEKCWREALPGTEFSIPLTLTQPEIYASDLEAMLYRDRLCFMTTYYGGSTANRVNNIHLAADRLDGVTLLPGDVFSYNETVGQRTEEAGFRMAGAYADGEVTEEIGGGICQVSSTLYCAAMYAQMKTVSRTNHYFAVGYLSMGYDATVSWKQPDYKFRNDREYPVKLVCYYDDTSITIEFWGTDTDGTHVSPYTQSSEVYDEEYKNVLVGYSVTAIRQIVDAQDRIIDRIQEPTGIYHLHEQDIKWPPEKQQRDAAQAAAQTVLVLTGDT